MIDLAALGGLFGLAFLAATVLPAQSEAAMVALQLAGHDPVALVVAASLGNTAGAVVNWLLGRGVERFRGRKWFPASERQVARAQGWYQRWGRWSLLMSWLPIAGDALTVVAGIMREPLWSFLILVAIGKTARYVVLALVTAGVTG